MSEQPPYNTDYESRELLVPIGVVRKCDMCAIGELESSADDPLVYQEYSDTIRDLFKTGSKAQYLHKCTNPACDRVVFFDTCYPMIEYDDLDRYVKVKA